MISDIKIERRGYNRIQVDERIAFLEQQLFTRNAEIDALKNQIDALTQRNAFLESRRELIESTLINAELSARKTIGEANIQAQAIVDKAKNDAMSYANDFSDKKNELENIQKRVEYILRSQLSVVEKIDKQE